MIKTLEMKLEGKETAGMCIELINKACEVLEYEYPLHGFIQEKKDGIKIFIEKNNNKNDETEITIFRMYTKNNYIYIDTEFYNKEIYEKYNTSVITGLLCDRYGRFHELSMQEIKNRRVEL